jgi:hypothetical protein
MAYYDDAGNDGQAFGRQGGIAGPRRPSTFFTPITAPFPSSRQQLKASRTRDGLRLVNGTMDAQPATEIQGRTPDGA